MLTEIIITYWITSNVSVTPKKSASFGRGLSVISQPNTLHVSEWVYENVEIKCTCSCYTILKSHTLCFSLLIPNFHVATSGTLTRAAWTLLHTNRYSSFTEEICQLKQCDFDFQPCIEAWTQCFSTTWECLHSYTLLVQARSTHPSFFSGLWGLAIRASMMIEKPSSPMGFLERLCAKERELWVVLRHTNVFHKVTHLLNVCQLVIVCNNVSNDLTLFHSQIVSIKPAKHTEPWSLAYNSTLHTTMLLTL